MIRLTVGNSYSKLEGLSIKQDKEIRQILSYEIDPSAAYFSKNHFNRKKCLMDKRGEFPTGLILLVGEYLKGVDAIYKDNRTLPKRSVIFNQLNLGCSPRLEQMQAVDKAEQAGRGTVVMPTGSGKSLTMAILIKRISRRALVVVPNLTLKKQLTESFIEYFGNLDNITVENIDSPNLKKAKDYDVLIIDEAHHSAAKTYRTLNKKCWGGMYYRFFFTATPFRSRDEEQILLESVCGKVIYELDYHFAVERGYIVPVEAYYIELPKVKVEGYSWAEVYKELVVENDFRNHLLHDILLKFHTNKIPTICLVKEIKHGYTLSVLTGAGYANGENGQSKDLITWFNLGKLICLIGTVGVLGEGVDTKPAEYIIIAGLGKSRNQFMQSVGRGLRPYKNKESCKVILFRDKSHKWTESHFKTQCKILKEEYGAIPIKID